MIQKFEFATTEIDGLIEVQPFCADDVRGCFIKDYSQEVFANNGVKFDLKETFYTQSYRGVIRALHFQREKQQPKLVRCISGKVFDVVVDLRSSSPTFKKWIGFELSETNKRELLIPAGCAHGYLVQQNAIVSYKCSEKFYGEFDDGIMWDDADIGIDWPIESIGGTDKMIIAEKDKNLQTFAQFMSLYGGF